MHRGKGKLGTFEKSRESSIANKFILSTFSLIYFYLDRSLIFITYISNKTHSYNK